MAAPHKSNRIRRCTAFLLSLGMCLSVAPARAADDIGSGPAPKKLIALGWDSLSPDRMLRNLKQIEQTPFNGVALSLSGTDEQGRSIPSGSVFSSEPWKREWFRKDIDTLRKVKSARLTDNFLSCNTTAPSNELFPDLFDDSAWKNVADHFRILASIANEVGFKGIMFDPEAYRLSVFGYDKLPARNGRTFAVCAAKLRQRGREVMSAIGKEYPEMTFFTLFMNSGTAMGALGADPREGLESIGGRYNLYPAFVNGWLDAVPPAMTIVDGFEMAYPHSSELQYLKIANAIRNTTLGLVASENHAKYRSQVRVGLSIYLDAYLAGRNDVHSDVFLDPPLTGSLVDRLGAAVTSALEVADEYVWVYGERYRWWPTDNQSVAPQSWEDILPGISQAFRDAANSDKRATARAAKELAIAERKAALRNSELANLVNAGDFSGSPAASGAGAQSGKDPWVLDSAEARGAKVSRDLKSGYGRPGSLRFENASGACATQTLTVKPHAFYAIRARVRQVGTGTPAVKGKWLVSGPGAETQPGGFSITSATNPHDAWQRISTVVRAPGGAGRLQLCLAADGQEPQNSIIWFDDVQVHEIGVN